ncbi:hypothetical protein HPB52_008457 [Rhipicephalus sanguineus]|uniref:Uncharacterized protein n=1 Tax=Rhipicephalus sanguineus TaxID=34632 RepID=A0A9D4QIG8_RHISA|nr:hypothetical protein HPB52_008457 [Rhipicephalus sanguineus]
MANGDDCCVLCSGPVSETEDFMRCARCHRRAHVSCIPWPDEQAKLRAYSELQNSRDSPIIEGSPMPSEASSFSSAVSVEIPALAGHPPGYIDGRLAAVHDLIGDAQKVISHLKQEMTTLRTKNERQRKQLERDRILQAQVFAALQTEMRSLREELASERVPPPLQPSLAQRGSSPDSMEVPATPPADGPAFGDSDDDEDFELPSPSSDTPRR